MNNEEQEFLKGFLEYEVNEEKLLKEQEMLEKKTAEEEFTLAKMHKFEDGETVIRFLPPAKKDAEIFVSAKRHYLGQGSKESLLCNGEDVACYAQKYLRSTGGEQNEKLAKMIKPSERWYFIVYVKGHKPPKGVTKQINEVRIISCPTKLTKQILSYISKDRKNILNPLRGRFFTVKRETNQGGFPEYTLEPDLNPSPIVSSESGMIAILKNIPDLTFLTKSDTPEREKSFVEGLGKIVNLQQLNLFVKSRKSQTISEKRDKEEKEAANIENSTLEELSSYFSTEPEVRVSEKIVDPELPSLREVIIEEPVKVEKTPLQEEEDDISALLSELMP